MEQIEFKAPNDVMELIDLFQKHNKTLYIVGGAVRDFVIGKEPKDFDFCTDAKPDELVEILDGYKVDIYNLKLGNIKVSLNNNIYAITTLRKEAGNIDGRYPEKIEFIDDINTDLLRRDFTINAMAIKYDNGFYLIDPLNGREDCKNRYLKFIGDAEERIKEDPIRILRALKFMLRLEFNISTLDLSSMFEYVDLVHTLDNNYKYKEFIEILQTKNIDKHLMIYKDFYHIAFPELDNFFSQINIINDNNVIWVYFFSLNKDEAINQLSFLDWPKQEKRKLRKALLSFSTYEEYQKSEL